MTAKTDGAARLDEFAKWAHMHFYDRVEADLNDVATEIRTLKAQRDQLLEAAEAVLNEINASNRLRTNAELDLAAAIANVKNA